MRKILAIAAGAAFIAAISAPIFAADMTVKGELVDVACSTDKGAGGKGDDHAACAMSCAKRGQPLGILTADALYVVTGDWASNKSAKLLDFVAKKVEVTGEVSEKGDRKLISIKSLKVAK
jgi:hypothetical protein